MSLSGLVVGWRIHSSVEEAVAGYALMVAFSFAIIWLGILLGSVLPTPEAVQGVGFAVIFPITFIASTFVPVETLPARAAHGGGVEPGQHHGRGAAQAVRQPGRAGRPATCPGRCQHPIEYTLIWIVALIVVCAPLAVIAYNRRTTE